MHSRKLILYFLGGWILLSCSNILLGTSVLNSKHDLSTASETETCAFCHTPHNAGVVPLWNRGLSAQVFTVYTSATMNTVCTNPPSGVSAICMSCHDGTLANKHDLLNAPGPGNPAYPGNCMRCHDMLGDPNLLDTIGTDLSDDHPVSMSYPTPAEDAAFVVPPDTQRGWADVPLYSGKVECSSCHNAHDPAIIPFLRRSNNRSGLCLTCHSK